MIDVLAITFRSEDSESLVIISSVMPSAKYSSLGSGLMFVKGSTRDSSGIRSLLVDHFFLSPWHHHLVHFYWIRDVLQRLVSQISEGKLELVLYVIIDLSRETDSSVLGQRLYPRCHVHGVAGNVARRLDHVAQVDAHPQVNSSLLRQGEVVFPSCSLNIVCTPYGV